MKRTTLTARRLKILRHIRHQTKREGYPPTTRELAKHLGVSLGTATNDCHQLWKRGMLDWEPGKGRTLALTEEGKREARAIPLLDILKTEESAT